MQYRVWIIAGLLANGLALSPSSVGASLSTPVDPFLCYTATGNVPSSVGGLTLADAFNDLTVDVRKVKNFCAPAAVDGLSVNDTATHLDRYQTQRSAGMPRPTYRTRLTVINSLGTYLVDVKKPLYLLAPTTVHSTIYPPAPDSEAHGVDVYTCYQARGSSGASRPTGVQLTVDDAFPESAKLFNVIKLRHLCAPADQAGQGVKHPETFLACYSVKPAGVASAGKRVDLHIANAFGNALRTTGVERELCLPSALELPPPPDPQTIAPEIDPTVPTNFSDATEFLYSGEDPIQTGVAPDIIDPARVAIVRGRVLFGAGTPLPSVTVAVLGHPEYGQTRTRADGRFDLAVNGGDHLVITFTKAGFLPAQRQAEMPWRDYVNLPDVVLVAPDPQVTAINLTANVPMQVVRGSAVSDADGVRRATLLFPQGTQAALVAADGTQTPLSTLHVRATEYTIRSLGLARMPASLPPASAYTYAVELSTDEAMAAGAMQVTFSQPVPFYLENFLGLPVGGNVPLGYYDPRAGRWLPSDNGRIVKITSISAGRAALDIDGDNIADSDPVLASLGITTAERDALATLYAAEQSLWRMPIPHFTTWDANWGWGPPEDAVPPNAPAPEDDTLDDPCERVGSVIECQNQTLKEAVDVVGTPRRLNYRSDTTPGRVAARTLVLPVSGDHIPGSLNRIDVEIDVAGRHFLGSTAAATNQTYTLVWDGKDAYGRAVQGSVPVHYRIGWVYDAVIYLVPRFGYYGLSPIDGSRARRELTFWTESRSFRIGTWDARGAGLGGWTLDVHHTYDPEGQVLYLGNGKRRRGSALPPIITTTAGIGSGPGPYDDVPAVQSRLYGVQAVEAGSDGSIYIAQFYSVRRVDPGGIIHTIADNATMPGSSGDGGLATNALFNGLRGLALAPDGSLYLSDSGNHRIRRIAPDGIITAVAGNGQGSFGGDGGLATEAQLKEPTDVAVSPDGTLYIADTDNQRIRRVGPDGIITTVAGNGSFHPDGGDGGPAIAAPLWNPQGVALAPDGSLYIGDTYHQRVRRVGTDGVITAVAGDGNSGPLPNDGGPATLGHLYHPMHLAFAPDGTLYINEVESSRIRRVTADNTITTVVGTGVNGFSGDGGPAPAAQLGYARGLAIAPDGTVHIGDSGNFRVRSLRSALAGVHLPAGSLAIASEDGAEVYVFDTLGRHLQTLDALSGVTRYVFGYDGAGRLVLVTDSSGNVTTITRATSGQPLAIVASGGQQTALTTDANGYLATVANPGNETTRLEYASGGLLSRFTDPRQQLHTFSYDSAGRLVVDNDPAGGQSALTRTDAFLTYTVRLTSALNRIWSYFVARFPDGSRQRANTDPGGLETIVNINPGDARVTIFPDGSTMSEVSGPDPRFGMQAPVLARLDLTTPGGLLATLGETRAVTLADPINPMSLTAATDTVSFNGRSYTSTFAAGGRTITDMTPAGRQIVTTLDSLGRPSNRQIVGLAPMAVTYDTRGRPATLTFGTGSQARGYVLGYDAGNRLTSVRNPRLQTTSFAYDVADRVKTVTLPDGRVVGYDYDANGNVTSMTPPGRLAHGFGYTPVDLMSSYAPPDLGPGDEATTYIYNVDRQLVGVTRPDGQPTPTTIPTPTIAIAYDSAGRVSSLTVPTGTLGYTYSSATGHVTSILAPGGGGQLDYTYDGPLPTSATWTGPVSGTVSRTYDNDFRSASTSVNGGQTASVQYDGDGFPTQAGALQLTRDPQTGLITNTTLDQVVDTRTYTTFGEPLSYRATVNGVEQLNIQYTERDALGLLTQKVETIGGQTATYHYTYDVSGRLTEVTKNGVDVASYDYDTNGNRTQRTTPTSIEVGVYDAQDRLTQYGNAIYTYTANGELMSKVQGGQTTTYAYDVLGNLATVTPSTGPTLRYVNDGRQRRIGKRLNTTLVQGWLYEDDLRPAAELDGAGSVVARFVYATRRNVPDYMIKNGTTYRIITDHLGSPRLVVNTNTGAIVERIDYDEFGNVLSDAINPGFQPFGFAGGLRDGDTNLVRFGARDYDPKVGRWVAKDPIRFAGGDPNLYGYVVNDPINRVDITGTLTPLGWWAFGICTGLVITDGISTTWQLKDLFDELLRINRNLARVQDRGCEPGLTPENRQLVIDLTASLLQRHVDVVAELTSSVFVGYGKDLVLEGVCALLLLVE